MIVKRGDIFYADLSPVVGSEQGGTRPVLIIQNDIGNRYSPTIIISAITSQINKAKLPTHLFVVFSFSLFKLFRCKPVLAVKLSLPFSKDMEGASVKFSISLLK